MAKRLFTHQSDVFALFAVWLLFITFAVLSSEEPALAAGDLAAFMVRGLAALVFVGAILPRLYRQGRVYLSVAATAALLCAVASLEEGGLEVIFFPETKGFAGWTVEGVYYAILQALPLYAGLVVTTLALDDRRTQAALARSRNEQLESELKFLRSQINPHILFNALNNIYSYVLEQDQRAPEMLLKLSHLLRYTLYECGNDKVSASREIESLEDFIALQEMGLEGRGSVNYSLEGAPANRFIAPYVLITLIENCFKHSLDTQSSGIAIEIILSLKDDGLRLKASNTFAARPAPTPNGISESGIGIANVRRRLELLFGPNFELRTQEAAGVFYTVLQMPYVESVGGDKVP